VKLSNTLLDLVEKESGKLSNRNLFSLDISLDVCPRKDLWPDCGQPIGVWGKSVS